MKPCWMIGCVHEAGSGERGVIGLERVRAERGERREREREREKERKKERFY